MKEATATQPPRKRGRPRIIRTPTQQAMAKRLDQDRLNAWIATRRAVVAESSTVGVADLLAIIERDGGRCVFCRTPVTTRPFPAKNPKGFDHLKSISEGGKHKPENLAVCCRRCNQSKGVRGVEHALFSAIDKGVLDREVVNRVPMLRAALSRIDRRSRAWRRGDKKTTCLGCVGRDEQIERLRTLLRGTA